MQQVHTAAGHDAGRESEDQQHQLLSIGTAKLRRAGLLNFGLAKPCYRQSAVSILTGSSHELLTGSSTEYQQHKDHRAVAAHKNTSRSPSSSPLKSTISNAAKSRCSSGCCSDDDSKHRDARHASRRLYSDIESSTGRSETSNNRCMAAAPGTPHACASSGLFRHTSSNSSSASTAADARHDECHDALQGASFSDSSSTKCSGNGCISLKPAATPVKRLQLQKDSTAKPKTYTAALLRRQEAQAHAKVRAERQQQQKYHRANLECMPYMQGGQSDSSAAQRSSSISGTSCSLPFPTPVHNSKAANAAHCNPISSPCSSGSSILGLHLSHLRRTVSSSSEEGTCSPDTPPLAAVAMHRSHGFFNCIPLERSCSSDSQASCNSSSAGSAARKVTKYGVPPAAAAGRSLLLFAMDAATADDSALRAAVGRAPHAGGAVQADSVSATSAVKRSWSSKAAAAPLSATDQAAATAVIGWYHAADGRGTTGAEVEPSKAAADIKCAGKTNPPPAILQQQQQQPCTCHSEDSMSAASQIIPRPRCMCGVGYTRLQRNSSLSKQQLQQEHAQAQPVVPHNPTSCSSSMQLQHQGLQAAPPKAVVDTAVVAAAAAAVQGTSVSGRPAGASHMADSAVPAVSAGCSAAASVEALLAASTWCVAQLECGFERMKRTSEKLTDTDGLSLREQYAQLSVK